MKSWLVLLMAGVLLTQVSIKTIVWLHFQLNRPEIIAKLCQKRFEKVNTCQGKCQLNKKLKSVEKSEEDTASFKQINNLKIEGIAQNFIDWFIEQFTFEIGNFSLKQLFSYFIKGKQDVFIELLKPPIAPLAS